MQGLMDAVAARIAVNCPAVLQVQTGQDAGEVVEMLAIGPDVTALVHPVADSADPVAEASQMVTQRVVHRFGVMLCLTFPGGFAEFETARDQVKATVRGWTPAGGAMPCQYAGGRTVEYSAGADGGRWLHQLEFSVPTQEDYVHQP